MPRNASIMSTTNTYRARAHLYEVCHFEADERIYKIEVEIGRYGPGSIDPEARAFVWQARGPYMAGLILGDIAWVVYRAVCKLLPEPGAATDPLHRRGAPSNPEQIERVRAALHVALTPTEEEAA